MRKCRVMVVDDYDDCGESLVAVIASLGYETACSSRGDEALGLAEQFKPDVAIVDLVMPGMDGFALARSLRTSFGSKLTLVAHTGMEGNAIRRKAWEVGFQAFLAKPCDVAEMDILLKWCHLRSLNCP